MARILFLAHRIPYPPNKGDKIRSWHFLEHLAEKHEVHLGFYVDDSRDLQHVPFLEKMTTSLFYEKVSPAWQNIRGLVLGLFRREPITLAAYPRKKLKAYIQKLFDDDAIDLIFLFSAATAPLVMEKGRIINDVRVIADLVDVDSAKWAAYGARSRWPLSALYRREAKLLQCYETALATVAAATLLVTDAEAELFAREAGTAGRIQAIPNGVDLDRFDPTRYAPQPRTATPAIIFTGAMDYRPNVEAVRWFCRHVWPLVRQALPHARFRIAGAPVAPRVAELASEARGIDVLGFVDDMAAEIAAADMVVAPLLTARGLQNKVLEGMAMAKPVIATPAAREGIETEPGRDMMVAEGPGDFAATLITLWQDAERRALMGAAARRFVETHYRWDRALARLDALVAETLEQRP